MKKKLNLISTTILLFVLSVTPVFGLSEVQVIDRTTGNQILKGFEYKLIKDDTNQEYSATYQNSKEYWLFDDLENGKYTLENIKYPNDYLKVENIKFEIKEDQSITKIMPKHEKKDTPSGGGDKPDKNKDPKPTPDESDELVPGPDDDKTIQTPQPTPDKENIFQPDDDVTTKKLVQTNADNIENKVFFGISLFLSTIILLVILKNKNKEHQKH